MSIRMSTGAMNSILSSASFKDTFANGVLCIYSGPQPANADMVETGDLLAEVTIDGAAFTPGGGVGLNFADAIGKAISKEAGETWKGNYLTAGTMGWFRFYANDKTTGASTAAIRLDGNIGTSRADIIVTSTVATVGGSITFDEFTLNFSILQ